MVKNKTIKVKGQTITLFSVKQTDYISLTDMARYRDSERTNYIIQNWMRTRSAIEFCGLWEQLNNPAFKSIEFDAFKNESGLNSFTLTPQKWIESTNAIGIISKSGRYGGTFAYRDIAFEFATWISAEFKFYFIKEFQRLKDDENDRLKLEWNLQRTLAKINYHIHTDAIKENLIPAQLTSEQISFVYASEADLLNVALFGKTALQWRTANPDIAGEYTRHGHPRTTGGVIEHGKHKCRTYQAGNTAKRTVAAAQCYCYYPDEVVDQQPEPQKTKINYE